MIHLPNRRSFLGQAATAAAGLAAGTTAAAPKAPASFRICAFEKYLQRLSVDELADTIRSLGFQGIEATVRRNGRIKPERVEEELPQLVEALAARGLEVTLMTSDVRSVDQPLTEKVLRTAASLGIRRYRMGFYRYDLSRPVVEQLDSIRPAFKELAALNRQLGISAVYQNHSGAHYVGGTLWDLHRLLQDIPPEEIGNAFDVSHATIEAGRSWPVYYNLMKPHITAAPVKDFDWFGRKSKNVPLGEGRVNPEFFQTLLADGFSGPISLHVEHLGGAGVQANTDALRRDLAVLRGWLAA